MVCESNRVDGESLLRRCMCDQEWNVMDKRPATVTATSGRSEGLVLVGETNERKRERDGDRGVISRMLSAAHA